MSVIFPLILTSSIILLIFNSPSTILTVFDTATKKAIDLSLTLIVVYAIWQGFSTLLEKSGISNKLAKLLKKPIKKLFVVLFIKFLLFKLSF